jgi:predicted transcriptional regulator
MVGKRVQLDEETWRALDLLAKDSAKDFQELADEAFADLLKKHRRPVTLRDALRQSLRRQPANDPGSGGQGRADRAKARPRPPGKRK